jgi:hypothetical protein
MNAAALFSLRSLRSATTLACALLLCGAASDGPVPTPERAAEAAPERAKDVLALQRFRATSTIAAEGPAGRRGEATLTDLNPRIRSWFVLSLAWSGQGAASFHLENPRPGAQRISLRPDQPRGVVLEEGGREERCDLWSQSPLSALEAAQKVKLPYAPLCGGRLYLRNQVAGATTRIEWVTDLLRDHAPGGDRIIGFVKRKLYKDKFLEVAPLVTGLSGAAPAADAPEAPAIAPRDERRAVVPLDLGIELESPEAATVLGRWYPAKGVPRVFASVFEPGAVAPELLARRGGSALPLDPVESGALVYLVAFDLSAFDLGFSIGTDHPRVGWSERVLPEVRTPGLPGPDGVGSLSPLVGTGMVSPALVPRVAATFTAGFKRIHGAFHAGPLAHVQGGTHYGFVEQGVVLSKLQPGLATLYALDDGTVGMTAWTAADDAWSGRIRSARQNGVPLLERDPATGEMAPGALVSHWSAGNWSGSEDESLRTLRAGVCLQESAGRRFLIYGWFSDATPAAMARVFQAYRCAAAMHLDMNALEHTYLALYERQGERVVVEHLSTGMAVVDKKGKVRRGAGEPPPLPRFLGFPDDRDFFYLVRREAAR